jgi:hypothetical protein
VRAYTLCCCQNHLSPQCVASADETHTTGEGGVAPASVLLHQRHRYPGDWGKQNPLPASKSALMLILPIIRFSKSFPQCLTIRLSPITNYCYVRRAGFSFEDLHFTGQSRHSLILTNPKVQYCVHKGPVVVSPISYYTFQLIN